jgi:rod shape-determining protein MreC
VGLGSPVLDEHGVLGQVTRVYPLVSEVTLITDRDHAIPVLNTRTGARGVAFGDISSHADAMELRYMAANADVRWVICSPPAVSMACIHRACPWPGWKK